MRDVNIYRMKTDMGTVYFENQTKNYLATRDFSADRGGGEDRIEAYVAYGEYGPDPSTKRCWKISVVPTSDTTKP